MHLSRALVFRLKIKDFHLKFCSSDNVLRSITSKVGRLLATTYLMSFSCCSSAIVFQHAMCELKYFAFSQHSNHGWMNCCNFSLQKPYIL